jgi:hypothetical protein
MSSNGPLSRLARSRITGFSAAVWTIGMILVVIVGATSLVQLPDELTAGRADEYRFEPWLNPDPPVADDEGEGVYSGDDGAVIRLRGLDPQQPLVIEELDDTMVFEVQVTGPGGRVDVEGRYGDPPSFDTWVYRLGELHAVVTAPDVELWIDAPRDERWRIRVTQPELEAASGTVSGFGPRVLRYTGDATTARLSARGDGTLSATVSTATGSEELVYDRGRFDRSVAWPDADLALFIIDTGDEQGWSITFEDPAPPASDPPTPAPSPETSAPSTPTPGSEG